MNYLLGVAVCSMAACFVQCIAGSDPKDTTVDDFLCHYGEGTYFPGTLITMKFDEGSGVCVHVICDFQSKVIEQPVGTCEHSAASREVMDMSRDTTGNRRAGIHLKRLLLIKKLLETYTHLN